MKQFGRCSCLGLAVLLWTVGLSPLAALDTSPPSRSARASTREDRQEGPSLPLCNKSSQPQAVTGSATDDDPWGTPNLLGLTCTGGPKGPCKQNQY